MRMLRWIGGVTRRGQEARLEVIEMRMLRWIGGVTTRSTTRSNWDEDAEVDRRSDNERTRSTTRSKLDEDAEVDRRSDKEIYIRNVNDRGTSRVAQASKKINYDYETFTSMSGTILPTMCQLLVCRVQYCQQRVKFWWWSSDPINC